ncbi:hypothetical protein OSSY52_22820 [Tepiditoga spiralis]|uniref:Organic solvent tolerance-like N-terminal domain-containing protein n=1 Tax=Tepiditoga spiralis TaxID=2108365 RepID=A0A7G1G6Q3_9BACT|nr:LptA/OstA family protein [Tepiditoga spiralis]BBE32141.1 hypothetical protein OSSY52_22820 [Tepiditoga spiralis]
MKKLYIILFILITLSTFSGTFRVKAENMFGSDKYYVLKGNAEIKKDNITINTNEATISLVDDDWRNLESLNTKIKTDTFEASSNKIKFDMKTEKGVLNGKVITIIKVDDSSLSIYCDSMNIDNKNKKYSGISDTLIEIYKDDYIIKTKKFEYNETSKKLILTGDVNIKNDVKKMSMKSQKAIFNTDTNEVTGENVSITLKIKDEEKNNTQDTK